MLFKFVGVVLQQCSKKSLVREKLDYLFSVADHNSTEDREVRLARRACAPTSKAVRNALERARICLNRARARA